MMGLSRLQYLFRILVVTLLGASSCSASVPRVLKTNTHCIRANDQPLCPGEELNFDSDFVKIAAGFPDNSKALETWTPYWEETLWIGSHSYLTLPGFDKSMKNIFFGDDSCLYGNVGWGFLTVNAQLIKCVNQRYVGQPYPNPWAVKNYGLDIAENQLDLSEPAHNKKGASPWDYRRLPQREGDPDNKLPEYGGFNPILQGKHQNSQYGIPNVEYPSSDPPIYDQTSPPLSYPPQKIPPIRPFPAPGVPIQDMPNVYDMPSFLPACPHNNPKCHKRPTPEEIRKQGSVSDPSINVATTDSSAPAAVDSSVVGNTASATVASTDGTTVTPAASAAASTSSTGAVASTDGTVASTDGTVASTDGTVASTDGTVASTDGTVASTDGIVASTDGTVASTGGTVGSTDTTVASSLTTDTTTDDDALLFGKKSRRSILHARDFRVQMR